MILYSDSDGVICDFHKGAEKIIGHKWIDNSLDIEFQGLLIHHEKEFWQNLPPMPDFHEYWEYISKYDPHILTAVPSWNSMDFKEVDDGKRLWYKKHIPTLPQSHIQVVYRKDKALYAKNGNESNILIDDHKKNIDEFNRAGGIGIYHVSARSTILKLKQLGY